MKYQQDIEINLPRNRVIELFDSTENLYKWQEGLQSFEAISGKPGQTGAKSKMHFKMGRREIDMIETITKRAFPEEFTATYEAKGVWNQVENFFEEVGPNKTKWTSRNEFRIKGLLRILAFLMPGMFKKQSYKAMKNFKAFAEGEGA